MLALSPASWGKSASALARMAFFVGWFVERGRVERARLGRSDVDVVGAADGGDFHLPREAAASMRASHSSGVRKSSTVRMGGSMQSTRRFGASTSTRRKSCAVRSPKPAFMPGWSARSMPPDGGDLGRDRGDGGAQVRGGDRGRGVGRGSAGHERAPAGETPAGEGEGSQPRRRLFPRVVT